MSRAGPGHHDRHQPDRRLAHREDQNEKIWQLFDPDNPHPTRDTFAPASQEMDALPIPWLEARDIPNVLLFLASDETRYITGVPLPVDAGCLIT